MKIETSINIRANKKVIWDILMDFNEYSSWNPFIQSIKGTSSIGMSLEITLPTMKFKPTVHSKKNESFFSWKGKLWIKGLFDGHHQFEIIELDQNNCLFIHKEKFSGLLLPFLKKQLNTDTRQGFEAMNLALKERAEKAQKNS